jgi:ribonuclease D
MPASYQDDRPVQWIDRTDQLEAFCARLHEEGAVAIDTEFHREKTYYPKLALVQIAHAGAIACVDPLAEGLDLAPLDAVLASPEVLKIMHAGRQDLEIFHARLGRVPAPLFDAQVAAAVLGLGEQIGYGPLVHKLLGITLAKTQVRTDWMRRPLHKDVVAYAADDVRYLGEVHRRLEERLRQRHRRDWLDEEQAGLLDGATYVQEPETAWLRVKGTDKLKGSSCAIAQRVADWRERTAMAADRPRRRILPDEIVIDLARQKPRNMAPLERMRGLDAGVRKKYGQKLLDLVAEAEALPREDWPKPRVRKDYRDVDDAVVSGLNVVLQARAREADISSALLANRADLTELAAGNRDLALLHGWRHELAGKALLDFLAGRSRLRVAGGKLVVESADAP